MTDRVRCDKCGAFVHVVPHPNSKSIKDTWGVQDIDGARVVPCKKCIKKEVAAAAEVLSILKDIVLALMPATVAQVLINHYPDISATDLLKTMREVMDNANGDGDRAGEQV